MRQPNATPPTPDARVAEGHENRAQREYRERTQGSDAEAFNHEHYASLAVSPVSERDVLLCRGAVSRTVEALWPEIKRGLTRTWEGAEPLAARLFPAPPVQQPSWRDALRAFEDAVFEAGLHYGDGPRVGEASPYAARVDAARAALLSDLRSAPTAAPGPVPEARETTGERTWALKRLHQTTLCGTSAAWCAAWASASTSQGPSTIAASVSGPKNSAAHT